MRTAFRCTPIMGLSCKVTPETLRNETPSSMERPRNFAEAAASGLNGAQSSEPSHLNWSLSTQAAGFTPGWGWRVSGPERRPWEQRVPGYSTKTRPFPIRLLRCIKLPMPRLEAFPALAASLLLALLGPSCSSGLPEPAAQLAPGPAPHPEDPGEENEEPGDEESEDVGEDDEGTSGDPEPEDNDEEEPNPALVWPAFPHLDTIVDFFRGDVPVWASLLYIQEDDGEPAFRSYSYSDTGSSLDFWPASTIKIYTATAALVLLEEYGLSLDTEATFYRRAADDEPWIEDTTRSFRDMIFDVFDYSSNTDYTLLLRFAGIDWLSTEFFTEDHGFESTALLVGYSSNRPHRYVREEEQRIVLDDGATELERTHLWSGTPYDDEVACGFRYAARANCSSPDDMVEHMRRLIFHEYLPAGEAFDLDLEMLRWMREGDSSGGVMLQPASGWAAGLQRVFPEAIYQHKAGRVGSFALDLHHVHDQPTETRFVAAIATQSSSTGTYTKVSEELTRMLRTPETYLNLDTLVDHVNPVTADLWVYTEEAGRLELVVKDFAEDADSEEGWTVLPGSERGLVAGEGWNDLSSTCLDLDGKHHVRGRFVPDDGGRAATSDLHYVIIDGDLPCE